jgi:hypothetical protein
MLSFSIDETVHLICIGMYIYIIPPYHEAYEIEVSRHHNFAMLDK